MALAIMTVLKKSMELNLKNNINVIGIALIVIMTKNVFNNANYQNIQKQNNEFLFFHSSDFFNKIII